MLKNVAAALLVAAGLSACVSPKYVVSDVTRHHALPNTPAGQTFAVVAKDSEQEQSLAFKAYSDVISARLSSLGLRSFSGETVNPDYVVTLSWSVEGPSPDIRTRDMSVGVGLGYGGWGRWGGYGTFWPDIDRRTDTRQTFVRRVSLNIFDGDTYSTDSPQRVFEGTAVSQGTNGTIDPVMPYIIQALFDQFPGASGQTRTVKVEIPADAAAATTAQVSSRSAK